MSKTAVRKKKLAKARRAATRPVMREIAGKTAAPAPTRGQVAEAAYFLHLAGAPGGPEAHWLRAERAMAAA